MTDLYHLLVWDAEITLEEDMAVYREAVDQSRVLFRELWAAQNLSQAYLLDAPMTDADTALDGFIWFLRHSVGNGYHIAPIIATSDDITMLKLSCTSWQPTLFFPTRMERAGAVPFTVIAEIIATAAMMHDVDKCEDRLEHLYAQLNHMYGLNGAAGRAHIRHQLCDLFTETLVPDDEEEAA